VVLSAEGVYRKSPPIPRCNPLPWFYGHCRSSSLDSQITQLCSAHGFMVIAALLYWTLRLLSFAVHIRKVCVLTTPFFASNTTLVFYFSGKEIWVSGAGLAAATLIASCPGYISRSVAGSYDNEWVAIFALLLTFYMFVNTGSLAWLVASAFAYFYMVSAWGGYIFIINLSPIYVVVLLVTERYSL